MRIDCSQPGATIFIDGEEVGKTPLLDPLPVDMGKHTITLEDCPIGTVELYIDGHKLQNYKANDPTADPVVYEINYACTK